MRSCGPVTEAARGGLLPCDRLCDRGLSTQQASEGRVRGWTDGWQGCVLEVGFMLPFLGSRTRRKRNASCSALTEVSSSLRTTQLLLLRPGSQTERLSGWSLTPRDFWVRAPRVVPWSRAEDGHGPCRAQPHFHQAPGVSLPCQVGWGSTLAPQGTARSFLSFLPLCSACHHHSTRSPCWAGGSWLASQWHLPSVLAPIWQTSGGTACIGTKCRALRVRSRCGRKALSCLAVRRARVCSAVNIVHGGPPCPLPCK